MPEHMGTMTGRLYSRAAYCGAGDLTDGSVVQRTMRSPRRQKDLGMSHRGTPVLDVVQDRIANILREWQPLSTARLARHRDRGVPPVDVAEGDAPDIAASQSQSRQ